MALLRRFKVSDEVSAPSALPPPRPLPSVPSARLPAPLPAGHAPRFVCVRVGWGPLEAVAEAPEDPLLCLNFNTRTRPGGAGEAPPAILSVTPSGLFAEGGQLSSDSPGNARGPA